MSTETCPKVLIIDDRPGEGAIRASALKRHRLQAEFREPEEVTLDDLTDADLVLVDFDLEDWKKTSSSAPIALRPSDGLALATVLRRQLADKTDASPTGFAILTAQVNKISHPVPHKNRLHIIAGVNNLEWIFEKTDRNLIRKISSLAGAIRSIPKDWSDGIKSPEEIVGALRLDESVLPLERYAEVVQASHPPIYELSQWSHGLAFVRWMLQSILVYPCFLWDSHRVSARLRIEVKTFQRIFGGKSELATRLSKLQYAGMLNDFDGRRWWRAAVERFLWDITDGDSQNSVKLLAALQALAGGSLKRTDVERPIVCVDPNYQPIDRFYSLREVVRVQPDDWPAYADAAFMTIEEVSASAALRTLVVPEDFDKLEPPAHE
jgi:hypothetical protein